MDAVEDVEVVRRHLRRFSGVLQVFPEARQNRADAERARRGERFLRCLARHEPLDRPPGEGIADGALPEPAVLRGREQDVSQHAHPREGGLYPFENRTCP